MTHYGNRHQEVQGDDRVFGHIINQQKHINSIISFKFAKNVSRRQTQYQLLLKFDVQTSAQFFVLESPSLLRQIHQALHLEVAHGNTSFLDRLMLSL